MTRQFLAVLMTAVLLFPAGAFAANPKKIEEKVAKLSPETTVVVRLNSGEAVRGRVVSRSADGFLVRSGGDERQLAFQDVRSIDKVKPPRTGTRWGLVGTGALIGLMVLGLVVYATSGGSLGPGA